MLSRKSSASTKSPTAKGEPPGPVCKQEWRDEVNSVLRFSIWKAMLFPNLWADLIYNPHHHHPPTTTHPPSPPHWPWPPQAISAKPSCIPVIFTCSLAQWSFAKSQWRLQILVGDLQCFVVFRSNVLVLFLFLHFGFGREQSSAFSVMLSYQLKALAPKGWLSWRLSEGHWKQSQLTQQHGQDGQRWDVPTYTC